MSSWYVGDAVGTAACGAVAVDDAVDAGERVVELVQEEEIDSYTTQVNHTLNSASVADTTTKRRSSSQNYTVSL